MLLLSCSNSKIKGEHRYLTVDKIFSSGKITPEKINVIYKIFGKPEGKIEMKGMEFLYRYITKTADMQYSLGVKDGEIVSFLLKPSENHLKYFKIKDALKILSHLELQKNERPIEKVHHVVVGKKYSYRSKDNRFEIQVDSSGKVERFIWSTPSSESIAINK